MSALPPRPLNETQRASDSRGRGESDQRGVMQRFFKESFQFLSVLEKVLLSATLPTEYCKI